MKNKTKDKQGFTLLELLVVVLIIGILAAIALPQYRRAIEKSKAAEALTILKSVYNSASILYLTNGTRVNSLDDLSISVPWTGNTKGLTMSEGSAAKSNKDWSLQLFRTNEQNAVLIHRLSGKYKGTGFAIWLFNNTGHINGALECIERKSGGIANFFKNNNQGDYCEKLFGASLLTSVNSGNAKHFIKA